MTYEASFDYGGGIQSLEHGSEILSANLDNSGNNVLADVLTFSAEAGKVYKFRFAGAFNAAATTTGSRWTVSVVDTPTALSYTSRWTLTATTEYFSYNTTKELPAAAGATSLATGNFVVIEGVITMNAAGSVKIQNASELNGSAITAVAGCVLEWVKLS
jgi:hypothetical protein